MATQPSTNIWLMKDVPLDNTYTNTILFNTPSEQGIWFTNKALSKGVQLNKQTYQRTGTNIARISLPFHTVYNYNYMMFQNTGHTNKWYYAFINKCEYVNENCTEISFEIDVIQTWLFDFQLGKCFVEREHVNDDAIGKHTVEENLPFGEYVIQDTFETDSTTGRGILISLAHTDVVGRMVDGVYSGLASFGYTESASGALTELLENYLDTPEQIAMLSMCSDRMIETGHLSAFQDTFTITRERKFKHRNREYVATNNKLYSYPYCFMTLDDYNGVSEEYRWEESDSQNDSITFQFNGVPLPRPCLEAYPIAYKHSATGTKQFAITYDNFPMCPFTIDTYRAWCSRNVPKAMLNIGSSLISMVMSGGANIVPSTIGIASSIGNTALEARYQKIHSASVGGTISNGGMNFYDNRIGFRGTVYTIKPEYAKKIDDYFTRYGYRINEFKVPNLRGRSVFNYVKTNQCTLLGSLPNDAREKIEAIFDKGIALWHDADKVGNFDEPNTMTGEV